MRQNTFKKTHWQHRYSSGGTLRNKRAGRLARPLSTREPIHLVLKAEKARIPRGLRTPQRFRIIHLLLRRYSLKFAVRIEQVSVQADHIHFLIRLGKRSSGQSFFRVLAGQIAQTFQKQGLIPEAAVTGTPKGLWKHRPFTRVIRGWRAFKTAKDYVRLNEREARGEIAYRKARLRGLSQEEWEALWE